MSTINNKQIEKSDHHLHHRNHEIEDPKLAQRFLLKMKRYQTSKSGSVLSVISFVMVDTERTIGAKHPSNMPPAVSSLLFATGNTTVTLQNELLLLERVVHTTRGGQRAIVSGYIGRKGVVSSLVYP